MAQLISAALRDAIVAAQPLSRDLARSWHEHPVHVALDAAFAGAATAEDAARVAEAWLADLGWVGELLAPLIAAQAATPLLQPPLRVGRDAMRIGAVLFESDTASIAASVLDAAALAAAPPRTSVVANGYMTVTRYVRAHRAVLRRWSVSDDGLTAVEAAPLPLTDGAVVRIDGRCGAQAIDAPLHDVVQLVATIRVGAAPTMREYAIADGRLLRAATLDDGAARTAMLLGLLRHCGRRDAAAQFDAASRDAASPFRWDAMREWVALDAAAALPRLAEMAAGDADPDVRAAAAATQALVEHRIAESRCRA